MPFFPRFDGQENPIRGLWDRLRKRPLGSRLFSIVLSRLIPYTGSIRAEVVELEPGYAKVRMRDRRSLRNHLRSVHAIALANLAEYTGNLALAYSMPDGARFIVKSMRIDYLKKARGTITGECHGPEIPSSERQEYEVKVSLYDSSGARVCEATLLTLVGPVK